eukprot:TRINITY_DN1288_c0_g1_i3.p1 TRINITY_DN1288_c0_g1~~TRINITY_DN1288_c0_g1_i3.p1  ORF type:complete len:180 (-),score=13.49 TRINITY_DN1288_c0_g1_i3:6-545(-)
MGCMNSKVPRQEMSVALAGIARSGKSTLSKQLRLIHLENPFSADELKNIKDIMKYNVFSGLSSLIRQISESEGLEFVQETENRSFAKEYATLTWEQFQEKLEELVPSIKTLWSDKGVRRYIAEFSIEDIERESQLEYVMTRIDDIADNSFIPNPVNYIGADKLYVIQLKYFYIRRLIFK